MRLVQRFTTGLTLTRDSLIVLRAHPELLLFPFLGGVATLAFGAVLYLTVFVSGLVDGRLEYLAFFAFYFGTTFVASFLTAALVSSVDDVFHGREPTLSAGVAAAWEIKTELAVWSLISAVVGVVLRSLERSDSLLTRVVAGVFALGWTVTTFFVIPVLVFEDVSLGELFSKSAESFSETWGETLSSNFGIGLVQFVLWLGGVVATVTIGVGLFALVPAVGTTTAILGVFGVSVGVYLGGQTVRGITKTALYIYASERTVPPEFDDFDFESLDGRTDTSTTPENRSTMTSFK